MSEKAREGTSGGEMRKWQKMYIIFSTLFTVSPLVYNAVLCISDEFHVHFHVRITCVYTYIYLFFIVFFSYVWSIVRWFFSQSFRMSRGTLVKTKRILKRNKERHCIERALARCTKTYQAELATSYLSLHSSLLSAASLYQHPHILHSLFFVFVYSHSAPISAINLLVFLLTFLWICVLRVMHWKYECVALFGVDSLHE